MRRNSSITSAEFRRFKATRRIHGRFFSLLIGPSFAEYTKYACVVSKKVSTKAVSRNLIKRRCREVIRKEEMQGGKPLSIVFYAKSTAVGATFADMKADIQNLLANLKG